MQTAFVGARVFDGHALQDGAVLVIDGPHVVGLTASVPERAAVITVDGGILAPGLIDLQVNGGGGLMVDGKATRACCAPFVPPICVLAPPACCRP